MDIYFTANRSNRSVVFHKNQCVHVKNLLRNFEFDDSGIIKTSKDQIWFKSDSFSLILLKEHFKSHDTKLGILEYSYNACQKCCK